MQTKRNSRIFAVGLKDVVHQKVLHELENFCEVQMVDSDMESGRPEIHNDDYILLFAGFRNLKQSEEADFTDVLEDFLKQLKWLDTVHPKSILLVSDTSVYGKLFGMPRRVREDELGYVCHTSDADMAAQCMRTAEHLCSRLAREKGMPIRIARVDWQSISDAETVQTSKTEMAQTASEQAMRADSGAACIASELLNVLKNGAAGEAYNLSGLGEYRRERSEKADSLTKAIGGEMRKAEEAARARSPLAPIAITPDTRKAELLS
jgi:hypothetical protein